MKVKRVPASMEHWDEMSAFVKEVLGEAGCNPSEAADIETAVEEIFTNVASYAYEGMEGDIEVRIQGEEDLIRVDIWDQGIPYNPLEKEEPRLDVPLEEREPGGLGIYMVRRLMDGVGYEYTDGCNHLILEKEIGLMADWDVREEPSGEPAVDSLTFEITLEDGRMLSYEAAGMFLVGERQYMAAMLLSQEEEETIHLFSMKEGAEGSAELAYIEDDEEYAQAARTFEMLFLDEGRWKADERDKDREEN